MKYMSLLNLSTYAIHVSEIHMLSDRSYGATTGTDQTRTT